MSVSNKTKHWAKLRRWQFRRAITAFRWGSTRLKNSPAVLGNAMPKSGSHLIIQVLQGLTHLGPFVNPGFPPVNRTEDNLKLPVNEILANIKLMKPGDIAYGYIPATIPYIEPLTQPGRATIFVYRDPRDMVLSHVFYATQMHKGHAMHQYYTEVLHTMEERINAAILGVEEPGSELIPVHEKWGRYQGWLTTPNVLSLRFEDLILDRQTAFVKFLDYLESRGFTHQPHRKKSIQYLEDAIRPRKSGTFRKGKPGNWKEYFTEGNISNFKQAAGDLLIQLGYEEDLSW